MNIIVYSSTLGRTWSLSILRLGKLSWYEYYWVTIINHYHWNLFSSKINLMFAYHGMAFAEWPYRAKSLSWIRLPTHIRISWKSGTLILLEEIPQQKEKKSGLKKLSVRWSLWVENFFRKRLLKIFWRRLMKSG